MNGPKGAARVIQWALADGGTVVFLTGAGISVESGLRPYRGDEGHWTVDGAEAMSRATAAYFHRHPTRSWAWHLDRRQEIRAARPNEAHVAIADLQRRHPGQVSVVTQNIDRLHVDAAHDSTDVIEIHGHLNGMRCSGRCVGVMPVPTELDDWEPAPEVSGDYLELLACPECGLVARPHVLWFDEFYDEEHYRARTAERWCASADVLVSVGTSGGVPVAERLAMIARRGGATLIDVNPNPGPLRELALRFGGHVVEGSAASAVPALIRSAVDPGRHSAPL